MRDIIPVESIQERILQIRGKMVMLDRDLAKLYCVETKKIKQQVRTQHKTVP